MNHRVLIVDDEAGIRQALKQVLEYENLDVRVASSGGEAISLYSEFRPHLVFLDVKMAGLDGLEILSRLRTIDGAAQVVMISGHGTIATAVEATQRGAFDFLEKPLDTDRLLLTVRNALAHAQLAGENARLREVTESRYQMVGASPALQQVRELIDKVGPTAARVLITGENGTGKELVARGLHEASPRSEGAFVEVNCAAIPSELIESELFGHMKGSFTGAFADRAGKFEQADGGTLFLDEVGDMSLSAQAKLLRVLQEGVVTRIGGSKAIQVDVRVLAATNKDLEIEIGEGRFREDLLYRLNVVPIEVPALRERVEDIPALVTHFAEQLAASAGVQGRKFADDAVRRLQSRPWPGNIRELRNAVERALILASGKVVTGADIERLLPWEGDVKDGPSFDAVQGGVGEVLPGATASRARLEHLGDRPGAPHAALESLQEDRTVRVDEGVDMTEPRDWDKELANIDKAIAKAGSAPPPDVGRRSGDATDAAGAERPHRPGPGTSCSPGSGCCLAIALAAALLLWPYDKTCGLQLTFFLGAVGTTAVFALLGAFSAWIHRRAFAHMLSLIVLALAGVAAAHEILPRTGYAKETRTWLCPSAPAAPATAPAATPSPAPAATPSPTPAQ